MREPYKVLVVDDEDVNIDIICEILGLESDFSIKTVENGEDALKMMNTFKPDIVLLDVMLPGMDGYEVCRRIKKTERYAAVKVLITSSYAMKSELEHGLACGADDYLVKPFDDDDLLERVKKLLN